MKDVFIANISSKLNQEMSLSFTFSTRDILIGTFLVIHILSIDQDFPRLIAIFSMTKVVNFSIIPSHQKTV